LGSRSGIASPGLALTGIAGFSASPHRYSTLREGCHAVVARTESTSFNTPRGCA